MLYLCFIKFKQHDMTTTKKIYNKLTAMNPISTYASSFGSHTSHFAQECADMVRSEILEFIPEGTLEWRDVYFELVEVV